MIGYDLDGVLAKGPPGREKRWGHMTGLERAAARQALVNHYARAESLYNPPEWGFIVITARKATDDVVNATETWLRREFGTRVKETHYLAMSRTVKHVREFKSQVINDYELTDYTEDNTSVLRGLTTPNTRLWHWREGFTEPKLFL